MKLSAIKQILSSGIKAGAGGLEKTAHLRPKPDGMDFFSRPISLDEAISLKVPDKISSFIKARQNSLTTLSKTVMNNLSIQKIDATDREKLAFVAHCQYKKFVKVTREIGLDATEFKTEFEKWGNVVDHAKKELWTPMTLNSTGQVSNFELLLNNVVIGYIQFMEKSFSKVHSGMQYSGRLEIEAAFDTTMPPDSAQITDLSLDPAKTLWALNLAIFSADNLSDLESEIENGLFVYISGLLLSIIQQPKKLLGSYVSNISYVAHHSWTQKLINLGLIENSNIIPLPANVKYYGIPTEYLRLINYNHDQLLETSVKANYLRNNKAKNAS